MQTYIELSRQALVKNLDVFRGIAKQKILAPVVKSNAYGHGLIQVLEILRNDPPQWLCTNYLSEAKMIRDSGFQGRILNVGPIMPSDLPVASQLNADILIAKGDTLNAWTQMAEPPRAHLKVDTGLSRQGFYLDEVSSVLKTITANPRKKLVGICTHFANVEDVTEHEYARLQIERFNAAVQLTVDDGYSLLRHAASSASSLILQESQFDLMRVGISFYGFWPSPSTRLSYLQEFGRVVDLEPVLTWKAKVNNVKSVKVGDFVGYGCTVKATRPMKLGLVPVGYFEGYPRLASTSGAYVLVDNQRCPLVGRISMNMMIVDLSAAPSAKIASEVVLIGRQGNEVISAQDVAGWAQTIHYELVTRLNSDIPRTIVS